MGWVGRCTRQHAPPRACMWPPSATPVKAFCLPLAKPHSAQCKRQCLPPRATKDGSRSGNSCQPSPLVFQSILHGSRHVSPRRLLISLSSPGIHVLSYPRLRFFVTVATIRRRSSLPMAFLVSLVRPMASPFSVALLNRKLRQSSSGPQVTHLYTRGTSSNLPSPCRPSLAAAIMPQLTSSAIP